jgi:DNA-binding response OmpR family regulator
MTKMSRILLLEPNRILAETYRQALESAGYSVMWCVDAQGAVNLADKKKPKAAVVELQLAGHSGIEFLYEFRSYPEWQLVPVIVLSSVPPSEVDLEGSLKELGVVAYHYKPDVTLRKLLSSVRQHVKPLVRKA